MDFSSFKLFISSKGVPVASSMTPMYIRIFHVDTVYKSCNLHKDSIKETRQVRSLLKQANMKIIQYKNEFNIIYPAQYLLISHVISTIYSTFLIILWKGGFWLHISLSVHEESKCYSIMTQFCTLLSLMHDSIHIYHTALDILIWVHITFPCGFILHFYAKNLKLPVSL